MSTANEVPETWGLTGDDAKETLTRVGRGALLRDAFLRLRWADGFSHARSMAYVTTLIFVQGVIALVGLASVIGAGGTRDLIVNTLRAIAPGPTGQVLTEAAGQARHASSAHPVALILGTIGALVTAAIAHGPDRTRAEPDLRRRAGSADAAQVRSRDPAGAQRGRRAGHRGGRARARPGHRPGDRQPYGGDDVGHRSAGPSRWSCSVLGNALALPACAEASPARVVLARVRGRPCPSRCCCSSRSGST